MTDRRPQDFGGTPDGITDSTGSIQAAAAALQPGDSLIISGGQFRLRGRVDITAADVTVDGDGSVRATTGGGVGWEHAPGDVTTGYGAMFRATGSALVWRLAGAIDQVDIIVGGVCLYLDGAVGADVRSLVTRGTQRAGLELADDTTDALIRDLDHLGKGYGVLSTVRSGVARVTIVDGRFEHVGTGSPGDGIEFNLPTFGASEIEIIGCEVLGYIGEATAQGIGIGLSGVTDARVVGCHVHDCEGDGIHLERRSHRGLVADCRVVDVGLEIPVGGNGSGVAVYDSDDVHLTLISVKRAGYHGLLLSGQDQLGQFPGEAPRPNARVIRCSVDTTRRDGIHMTAQKDARIDNCTVRDPSLGNDNDFAGIICGRQGATIVENDNVIGVGNVVTLSGATTPLAERWVRPESINCDIDGVTSSGTIGDPWADGTLWSDGTGWIDSA